MLSAGWLAAQSAPGGESFEKASDSRFPVEKKPPPPLRVKEIRGAHWWLGPLTEAERAVSSCGMARREPVESSFRGF